MFSYTVRCRFVSDNHQEVSSQWLAWLKNKHIEEVLEAGALSAEIFKMDSKDEASIFEVRYCFESLEAFQHYETTHAPRLRQDGMKTFPLELGLEYSRTTGERVGTFEVR